MLCSTSHVRKLISTYTTIRSKNYTSMVTTLCLTSILILLMICAVPTHARYYVYGSKLFVLWCYMYIHTCMCIRTCTHTHTHTHTGESKFEKLEDLVEDGLIILYFREHNVSLTMQRGRAIQRRKTLRQTRLKRQTAR